MKTHRKLWKPLGFMVSIVLHSFHSRVSCFLFAVSACRGLRSPFPVFCYLCLRFLFPVFRLLLPVSMYSVFCFPTFVFMFSAFPAMPINWPTLVKLKKVYFLSSVLFSVCHFHGAVKILLIFVKVFVSKYFCEIPL